MSKKLSWGLGFYSCLMVVYALFSYALTAPNLILSSNEVFWKFQTYMWQTFFNNRQLLSYSYAAIISLLWICYFFIIKTLHSTSQKIGVSILISLILVIMPLMISNNALSYDVFNYIFNAKMVVIYHANPHVKVTLDYAFDDWTRFMHNTHTPAPYGYGWTALSIIPYLFGMGKFLPTWLSFRFFSLISLGLLFLTYRLVNKKVSYLLFLNPLLLIEVLSNSHNDLWMMVPAIMSLILMAQPWNKRSRIKIILSILLLAFSISTKFATALLIPVWLLLATYRYLPLKSFFLNLVNNWPVLASVLMFLPLLMSRSQQFHPWYLTWAMVWLPLLPTNRIGKFWQSLMIVLSVSSLYRYLPYLWTGEYTAQVIWQQKIITWIPLAIFLLYYAISLMIKLRPSSKA